MSRECPQCGTHPMGTSYVLILTTRGDVDIEAVLCGECGVVYVEDPDDSISAAITESISAENNDGE